MKVTDKNACYNGSCILAKQFNTIVIKGINSVGFNSLYFTEIYVSLKLQLLYNIITLQYYSVRIYYSTVQWCYIYKQYLIVKSVNEISNNIQIWVPAMPCNWELQEQNCE